jgi:phosphohistidine phosphatase
VDLILIRHAKAEEGSLSGSDADRALTADGRQAALAVGASLKQHGVTLDALYTSPLVRAVETAELIAVALDYAGALTACPPLAPPARTSELVDRVLAEAAEAGIERLALVGHEPSMGNLVSLLLGKPGLAMPKGAAVRLAVSFTAARRHATRLVWVVRPKHLQPRASLDGL